MYISLEQLAYQINHAISNSTVGENPLTEKCLYYKKAYFKCLQRTNPFNFFQISTWLPSRAHMCSRTEPIAWERFQDCYYQANPNWVNYGLVSLTISVIAYAAFRHYARNR